MSLSLGLVVREASLYPTTWRYDAFVVNLFVAGKLSPPELVASLMEAPPQQLDELPFGSLVLVVRAPDDADALFMADLVQSALKDAPPSRTQSNWMPTSEFPTVPAIQAEPNDADQIELLSELTAAPHCVVPLRGSERTIDIGRAPDSDIRLSDPSVSARHAQLLISEGGTRFVDLDSKNGSSVNGRRVRADEQLWLQSMDRLSFGRIHGFVCDPRALRGVLRQGIRISF